MRRAALLLLCWCAPALAAPARFALVIGNDQGSPARPRLWFAEQDARRIADTLVELGDFARTDVLLLQGRRLGEVLQALGELEWRVARAGDAGAQTLLLVYYSGHADAAGLELGPEKLPFEALQAAVTGSKASLRLAVVDACDAGKLTQVKGGRPAPGIDFPLPAPEPVTGTAFVASTAVGELAQESAALGGSFFSHHFEAGLRGAADGDADGRVTLAEAFRYTSARTVSGTLETANGAQHPTYALKMSGRGDVVLAELRRAEARLTLAPNPGGRYVLRGPRGLLVELAGEPAPVVIGLPAGAYQVERRQGSQRALASVTLPAGASRALTGLSPAEPVAGRAKGGPAGAELGLSVALRSLPVSATPVGPALDVAVRVPLGVLALRPGVGAARAATASSRLTVVQAATALLWPVVDGRARVELGPQLGAAWLTQAFTGGQRFSAWQGSAGAVAGASWSFGLLRIGVELGGAAQLVPVNGEQSVLPAAGAGLWLSRGL